MVEMRVIFLGTPEFAVPSLRALVDSHYEVCAVFTQPDRPAGRGQKPLPSPVKQLALRNDIPVFQPVKIRAEENRAIFERLDADFIVVVAFGQILPGWLLRSVKVAPVNVHASLLPKYRGAAPVVWAIRNGETVTGVTTMIMDEQLDTGPMLLKREVAISNAATAGELGCQLSSLGAEILIPTLEGLRLGTVQPKRQNEAEATWAPRIEKESAEILWDRSAGLIHNDIRAFNPWPLAYTSFRGKRIQVLKSLAEPGVHGNTEAPGTYLGPTADGMRIACGNSTVLQVLEVKLEGKGSTSGRGFANGFHLRPGEPVFGPDTSIGA